MMVPARTVRLEARVAEDSAELAVVAALHAARVLAVDLGSARMVSRAVDPQLFDSRPRARISSG